MAKVTPLFKEGTKCDSNNYRLVMSKIYENNVVQNRLIKLLR